MPTAPSRNQSAGVASTQDPTRSSTCTESIRRWPPLSRTRWTTASSPACHLRVQRVPAEAGGERQRLEPRRYVGGRVRVHRAAAALVTGVERGEQVDHLGAAHLADDEPVRPHPQRLADQVAQADRARALGVGGPRLEPDDVRVVGAQLAGVLDEHASGRRGSTRPSRAASRVVFRSRCRR